MKWRFDTGDIVKLRTGGTPMVVLGVSPGGGLVYADYCPATNALEATMKSFKADRFELVTDPAKQLRSLWETRLTAEQMVRLNRQMHEDGANPNTQPEGDKTMTRLYQTKEDAPRFGTLLATNSQGKSVLEMKGTGEVLAFDPKEIEVVMPYTVGIRFMDRGTTYHYLATPGSVAKGDVILVEGSSTLAVVRAVDTKSSVATKTLRGRKFVTEGIIAPVSADEALEVCGVEDDA